MSVRTDFDTEAERVEHFEAERRAEREREGQRNRAALVQRIIDGMGYSRAKAERLAAKMLGERARDPLAGRFG